ncbi:hypothetical protein WL43_11515 [Burkholderia ubonensis]|nr:hypothetical protein WL43_11515 [Burkholderia ubonensis]
MIKWITVIVRRAGNFLRLRIILIMKAVNTAVAQRLCQSVHRTRERIASNVQQLQVVPWLLGQLLWQRL